MSSSRESLKKAIESNDAAAISRGMEELTQAQHKAAASLYQQASGSGAAGGSESQGPSGNEGGGAASGGSSKSGDVIDAEVVDDK